MDQAVDGRGGGHGIFEDGLPLGEWEVAGNHQAAPLIAVGKEGEEYLHLLPILLDVTDVVDDEGFIACQSLELLSHVELTFGAQQILNEQLAGAEQDSASPRSEGVAEAAVPPPARSACQRSGTRAGAPGRRKPPSAALPVPAIASPRVGNSSTVRR